MGSEVPVLRGLTASLLSSSSFGAVPTGSPCDSFDAVKQGPADPILGISKAYKAETRQDKVDGGVGAYRTEEGSPYVMNVVKEAEKKVLEDLLAGRRNIEYLSQAGDEMFTKATRAFLFGSDCGRVKDESICTVQTLSGTGALRVGGEFLRSHRPCTIAVPNPTWGNHNNIFKSAGLPVTSYRYFNKETLGLDLEGMLQDLKALPKGSCVILHACAHNPTGVDPTKEQWGQILKVFEQHDLLPFFDSAYQGFATGDVDLDAYAVRLFEKTGMEMIVSQSYSKNMGLYGERIGALSVCTKSKATAERVQSQLHIVIRASYSSPPKHGAAIVAKILNDPTLLSQWKAELKGMVDRIDSVRTSLRSELEKVGAPGNWEFMTKQIGMFTFTSLSKDMCEKLATEHAIYITTNGRISLAGLKVSETPKMARAIKSVMGSRL